MSDSLELRIWCNQRLPASAHRALEAGVAEHELVVAEDTSGSNLDTSGASEVVRGCDIAFGQPDPRDVVQSKRLRWVHLSTAGYTKYDRDDLRHAVRERHGALTNSSSVYAEPCAQHVLALMLSLARRLPEAQRDQEQQQWDYLPLRARSRLLGGDTVAIVGYGAIGQRLIELLSPFAMTITAVRRSPRGDEGVRTLTMEEVSGALNLADHVVNLLPAGANTENFFNAERFSQMKRGARFYNVGRGTTVDQTALVGALGSGKLDAAYLDVTTPEPLPPGDALWTAPNCYITPHSAGGHHNEYDRLVSHFLANLKRFETGASLRDQVV